jgi:hypothetical protein
METKVTISAVITAALWLLGATLLVLVALGYAPGQLSGLALLPIWAGAVIYFRSLIIKQANERECAAFELGKLVRSEQAPVSYLRR